MRPGLSHAGTEANVDERGRLVRVRVVPGSSRQSVEDSGDGTFRVRLKSPPEKGRANVELIEVMSEWFGVPRSSVSIVRGAGSRTKTLLIDGL